MPKMKASKLRALLAAEKADAMSAFSASKLSEARADAMDYYLGDMSKDMPAAEGRSKAVSTDVADTVEGLMPSLMDIFCGSDQVVRFEPVGPEDVEAAEQETDVVNHVFMQQNPGFLVLYSFIKDALLQKFGVVKVWQEDTEHEERETYYDQQDDAFALVAQAALQSDDFEIVEHTENTDDQTGVKTHDVTIVHTRRKKRAKVEGVPPEEFGVERGARAIKDCNYCYHEVIRTESELIEQGYDEKQVKAIGTYADVQNSETQSRDTVDEGSSPGGGGINEAGRKVKITEHYVRMDYEGRGRSGLYRVTTGGDQGEILKRDGEDDIVPVDVIPFAMVTPIIIPHRLIGRSIADLVMDIQRIKTALIRGALDNLYLHNNARVEVAESHAGVNTLDDLLVSRPGGVVRTKTPGGLQWQVVPDITGSVYPALEYMDATREWRTGVTRQGQGIDANALQNQSATAVNQAFTAAQARMKLIARIIAETGMRDLFALLHQTIRKNGGQALTLRLRGKWDQVDPRQWKTREDMTINVGLGTGGRAEQASHLMMLLGFQKEAIAGGMVQLVQPKNVFSLIDKFCQTIGLKSAEPYFTDPNTPEAQQAAAEQAKKPDPKMMEIQGKLEIEKLQAQADIATTEKKAETELITMREKHALEMEKMRAEIMRDNQKHQQSMTLDMVKGSQRPKQTVKDANGNESVVESDDGGAMAPLMAMMMEQMRKASAPKTARKNPDGSWTVVPVEAN